MEFNATFLVSAISFILFTLIMNKIFYKPLEKVMAERQKFIDDAKTDALNSSSKADAILKDREDRLNKSTADSKNWLPIKLMKQTQIPKSQRLKQNKNLRKK